MARRAEVTMVDPPTGRSPRTGVKNPWLQRWMRIVHTLGNLWAWVLLTLFYVVVVTPIGLLYRLTADPLRARFRKASWQPLPSQYDQLKDATLQS